MHETGIAHNIVMNAWTETSSSITQQLILLGMQV
jgi:hypothetical protein